MKSIILSLFFLLGSYSLYSQAFEVEGFISAESIFMNENSPGNQVNLYGTGFPRRGDISWTFGSHGGLVAIVGFETDDTPNSQDTELRFVTAKDDNLNTGMCLSADGALGIGTLEPSGALHVVGEGIVTERNGGPFVRFLDSNGDPNDKTWVLQSNAPNHGDFRIRNETDLADRFIVKSNGDVIVNGMTVHNSDARLKTNARNIENALDKILSLSGIKYEWKNWKDKGLKGDTQIGLLAQEVEKVLPELVAEDQNGYKLVAYANLTAVLVEALKEQQNMIELLSNRVTQIEKTLRGN